MRKIIGGLLLALAALTACSSAPAEVDDATLLAELKAVGVEPANGIESWRTSMVKIACEEEDPLATSLMLTMRDVTEAQARGVLVAAKHYCPDRLPAYEKVVDDRW